MEYVQRACDAWQAARRSLLFVLGAYGTLFSLKHYERFRRHATFAGIYRNHVESLLKSIPQNRKDIRALGDELHERTWLFRVLAAVRLHWLWAGMPALISLGGVLLLIGAGIGWIN